VFTRNRGEAPTEFDEVITAAIIASRKFEADPDEAHKRALTLKVLTEARAVERGSIKRGISADQWAAIIANVAGIAAILYFEKANVLTSKALSFVPKITT
jgi:hypothetical protein